MLTVALKFNDRYGLAIFQFHRWKSVQQNNHPTDEAADTVIEQSSFYNPRSIP